MDIFEYIDRVKANFDKKPEPRYNMKKYFMGGLATPKRGLVDEPGSYGGFKQVTDKEFTELYKEFQSLDNLGTDPEFVDFLNEKKIKPGTLGTSGEPRPGRPGSAKKFTTKTVSGRRQRLNLKTKVKPNVSPKKQAEVAKINELIQKEVNIANKGSKYISPADISFKVEDQLNMKPYFVNRINAQGKKIKIRDKRFAPNSYPAFKNLDSMVTKVDNVLKEMLISEEPLNDYFYKELAKRTDLDKATITKIRNNVPTYKVIADQGADKLLTIKNEPALKNLSLSQQLVEAIEIEKGMPTYIDYGEGKKSVASPRTNIMQFAKRSWNNNKGQGEIKFFDKNRKLIKWERGLKLPYKNVSFLYQGKKYSVNSLTPTLVQKDFPEVKKVTDAANKLRTIQIDDPFNPGKKISVNSLIRKVQVNGYKWKPRLGTINVLHGPEGVKNKPFTNLTYNTRDINQLEAGFTNSLKAGTITETQYKKIVKELYKPFVKGNLDEAIISRITKQAQQLEKGKFYGFDELKDKQVANLLAKAGFRCGAAEGLTCDNPKAYFKDIKIQTERAKKGQPDAIKKFENAGNVARKSKGLLKATGYGILGEAGFEGAFVLNDILSGMPVKEAFQRSLFQYVTPKDFGRTKDAEISKTKRIVGDDPRSQQYVKDLASVDKLMSLYDRYEETDSDVVDAYTQEEKFKAEEDLRNFVNNFDPKTFERTKFGSPEQQAFATKEEVEDVNKIKRAMDIDPFMFDRNVRRTNTPLFSDIKAKQIGRIPIEDKLSQIAAYGGVSKLSSGGIASGPPPEKGPQSQGLAYLMKNGKR